MRPSLRFISRPFPISRHQPIKHWHQYAITRKTVPHENGGRSTIQPVQAIVCPPYLEGTSALITCHVKYVIDPYKLAEFEAYSRLWMKLVTRMGGTHHGYFLPGEGANNVAYCLFSFSDLATYERYRKQAESDPECIAAVAQATERRFILSYERSFLKPLPAPRIRSLALCVFHHQGKILVNVFNDPVSQRTLSRPLGGGIEFGELAHDAVMREIQEEIGQSISDVRLIGTLESLFTYSGIQGHEIVQVFDARFDDASLYQQPWLEGRESDGSPFRAKWCDSHEFDSTCPLVPAGLLELLRGQSLLN
ncbi:NIPSNAP family protein [Pseudomonas sp. NPDC089996]|uniref:NIPSNAP family protein n=1 Tax=Pseudomonas sp. NPDC089996 TaxID=3364474 RepID=UPI0037F65B78